MPRISLENIRIASPCQVPWDGMHGNEQQRYCAQCRLQVFNLSGMSRADAEALVEANTDGMCVRLYRRADGTVLTADCPVGRWDVRRRLILAITGLAALLLLGITWSAALATQGGRSNLRVRDVEPFRTVLNWIDPPRPPPNCAMGAIVSGGR